MTDSGRYSRSTSSEMYLNKFIRDTKRIILSLQKQLKTLQNDMGPQERQQIETHFYQELLTLTQLHHKANSLSKAVKITSQNNVNEIQDISKYSAIEVLKIFAYESRHIIASIEGWVSILQNSANREINPPGVEQLGQLVQLLSDMHNNFFSHVDDH